MLLYIFAGIAIGLVSAPVANPVIKKGAAQLWKMYVTRNNKEN